jgi:non-canonical purine NTP pyrophosphatase (RdgB/HAM1 family)
VKHHKLDLTEVQSLDPQEVVEHKAKEAYRQLKQPVVVDDVSLSFTAMGKLPGPFIKYFLEDLELDGICQMMSAFEDKSAIAEVVYGFYDGQTFKSFSATAKGTVPTKPQGGPSMGWNAVFIPEGGTKTYAELSEDEYAKVSVRNQAVSRLKEFLL